MRVTILQPLNKRDFADDLHIEDVHAIRQLDDRTIQLLGDDNEILAEIPNEGWLGMILGRDRSEPI